MFLKGLTLHPSTSASSEKTDLSIASGSEDGGIKIPCKFPRPVTVEEITDAAFEDEATEKNLLRRNGHPVSLEKDGTYFVDYYKQVYSFLYFATGKTNGQSIRECFPEGIDPTHEDMKMVHAVVQEIGDRLTDGFGIQIVMSRELLRDPLWTMDPVPDFETQDDRIHYFIYAFENNPFATVSLLYEINPALDIMFILSDYEHDGELSHLNALRTKLRGHLYTRLALLADLIFYGYFLRDAELEGTDGDNLQWIKGRVASCLKPSPITNGRYGELDLDDWPIKAQIDPNDWTKPWDGW
ncbi:hypothetical protein GLAREA_01592 [Glarea lozoyensis ATCC 20868]|uniref:Uncharacterized protein n=1 Tax=Glarea lozoyensis (strain ATCC 20868 / MF5171) TaxID=1116229 RepID=S3CIL9_GLAL2|nr:uncharacterized protein GLAREA_01592 [Glarea lozoyensis ATCC 20868]EPE25680.1 hypothetical protein GLAREA_01592 [Glarea lozoyensis ATCC 20868]